MDPLIQRQLEAARFDQRVKPPEDVTVLTIEGRTVGTLGSYTAITGKPKAGKTLFTAAMLASAFTPYDIYGCKIHLPAERNSVVYIDTEQSRFYHWRMMDRVRNLMLMDNLPPRLTSYMFRRHNPETIQTMIAAICEDPKVSVIFIDGLLDLVRNYNDVSEAWLLSEFLKKITDERNILAVSVIHTSKRDGYTIGHLGSAVERWAESTFTVEKDETRRYITLSPGYIRHSIDEFKPITLFYNGQGFERTDIDITAKKRNNEKGATDFTKEEHNRMVTIALGGNGDLYDHVVATLAESQGFSKAKAKSFIKYWIQEKLVQKGPDGLYHFGDKPLLYVQKDATTGGWRPLPGG